MPSERERGAFFFFSYVSCRKPYLTLILISVVLYVRTRSLSAGTIVRGTKVTPLAGKKNKKNKKPSYSLEHCTMETHTTEPFKATVGGEDQSLLEFSVTHEGPPDWLWVFGPVCFERTLGSGPEGSGPA